MGHCAAPPDVEAALSRVLAATEAAEAALDPLDVEAFDRAVAERARALSSLDTASPSAPTNALRHVAERATEADRRLRERAALALADLREELRGLAAGRSGLGGYRPSIPNVPRFSDRRG